MTSKILFVDDDTDLLAALRRNLRNLFAFDTASSGAEGLQMLRTRGPYALLVVDMRMPEMDGIEFLELARKIVPDAVPMVLTGSADMETAAAAVNQGHVFKFFHKPCPPEMLVAGLEHGLKEFELRCTERDLLEKTLAGCVMMTVEVLGIAAPYALRRGQALREAMGSFARAVGAGPAWELEIAAVLAQIGCTSLPPRVLQKLRKGRELSDREKIIIRRVPQTGHDLLARIPRLEKVAQIVLYQDKAFDGSGFPTDDCAGKQIPLGARMLKILGDRLALEDQGITGPDARAMMANRAKIYDPGLLEECFACFREAMTVRAPSNSPISLCRAGDLREGQIAAAHVATRGGVVLATPGRRLTPSLIKLLRNYSDLGAIRQAIPVHDAPSAGDRAEPPT